MFPYTIVFALFLSHANAFAHFDNPKNIWAILVAGSRGFQNYHHQADVAHAYHLLVSNGVHPDRIITFSYDDIANNDLNPYKGKIFNDKTGTDYYQNMTIDFRGKDVSKANFVRVIEGDQELKQRGYKILESQSDDNVFIYYSGLGGGAFIYFTDNIVYDFEMMNLFEYLRARRRYGKLVFYLDSSFSASMFETCLPTNMNVYAITASSSAENITHIFCDEPTLPVCLANEFSYNWITDSEQSELTQRTVADQFAAVKSKTMNSTVSEFGDMNLKQLALSEIQGRRTYASGSNYVMHQPTDVMHFGNSAIGQTLAKQLSDRTRRLGDLVKETVRLVVNMVTHLQPYPGLKPRKIEVQGCIREAIVQFSQLCFDHNLVPEVRRESSKLIDLCERGYPSPSVRAAIARVCL